TSDANFVLQHRGMRGPIEQLLCANVPWVPAFARTMWFWGFGVLGFSSTRFLKQQITPPDLALFSFWEVSSWPYRQIFYLNAKLIVCFMRKRLDNDPY
ncbi:MAG: hypothetical protein V4857_17390, partial [Pseudomonadota bacterium]